MREREREEGGGKEGGGGGGARSHIQLLVTSHCDNSLFTADNVPYPVLCCRESLSHAILLRYSFCRSPLTPRYLPWCCSFILCMRVNWASVTSEEARHYKR